MRALFSAMALLAAVAWAQGTAVPAQSAGFEDLPHAFPREGAVQVFDNPWGTAWDATWTPNKPMPMYRHRFDYVGLDLTDSTFNLTAPGGQPRASSLKKGVSYFLPKGAAHIEEGLSSDPPPRAILIDLKDMPSPVYENTTKYVTAFPAGTARRVLENPRVVIWDQTWTSSEIRPMVLLPQECFPRSA
jgi:hypothetical protein